MIIEQTIISLLKNRIWKL